MQCPGAALLTWWCPWRGPLREPSPPGSYPRCRSSAAGACSPWRAPGRSPPTRTTLRSVGGRSLSYTRASIHLLCVSDSKLTRTLIASHNSGSNRIPDFFLLFLRFSESRTIWCNASKTHVDTGLMYKPVTARVIHTDFQCSENRDVLALQTG